MLFCFGDDDCATPIFLFMRMQTTNTDVIARGMQKLAELLMDISCSMRNDIGEKVKKAWLMKCVWVFFISLICC